MFVARYKSLESQLWAYFINHVYIQSLQSLSIKSGKHILSIEDYGYFSMSKSHFLSKIKITRGLEYGNIPCIRQETSLCIPIAKAFLGRQPFL